MEHFDAVFKLCLMEETRTQLQEEEAIASYWLRVWLHRGALRWRCSIIRDSSDAWRLPLTLTLSFSAGSRHTFSTSCNMFAADSLVPLGSRLCRAPHGSVLGPIFFFSILWILFDWLTRLMASVCWWLTTHRSMDSALMLLPAQCT